MEKPLISFILTYYNLAPSLLTECIESILALSLRPFEREIILIDDGSQQSPLPLLGKYIDDIIYLRQRNKGLSEARNIGLRMATGEYVQFVDADDYLLQAPYEHCIDIARYQKPDIVLFDFATKEQEQESTFTTETPVDGAEYMTHHNLQATAWGLLFRLNILGELRFTPGIYHEDEEFTPLLILRAESICATDAKAYFYRRRPHSITTDTDVRKTIKRLTDVRQVISKLSHIADTLPMEERLALQRRVAQLTMDYIYNIIIQTRSRHYLDRKIESLRQEGLFPLPDRDYTMKYKWFRKLTNSSAGLSLLMRVLPMTNRER